MIKFELKGPKIQINLDKLTRAFASAFAREVAEPEMQNQKLQMVERAQTNKRAGGGPIKSSYSSSYIEAIVLGRVRGANGVRKTSQTPNLTVTGEFLQSIQTKPLPNGAKAFFSGSHATSGDRTLQNSELAGFLFSKGYDGWFDFSKEDKARFHKAFDRFLDKHTKDLVTIK